MSLTPQQRSDLVTVVHHHLFTLGIMLVPIFSGTAWKVDQEAVHEEYERMSNAVRALAREFEFPGTVKQVPDGPR